MDNRDKLKRLEKTFILSEPRCRATCCKADCVYGRACTYQVAWNINAYMQVGSVDPTVAFEQHDLFCDALKIAGAEILTIPFVHGAYDSVFVKDNATLIQHNGIKKALLANLRESVRQSEQGKRREAFEKIGFEIHTPDEIFEGGDLVMIPGRPQAFLGFGFRSQIQAEKSITRALNVEVRPLELVDPHFYHLDTALTLLSDGSAFACKEAFSAESWQQLEHSTWFQSLTRISFESARRFALNLVEVGNTVILGRYVPEMVLALRAVGKNVRIIPLDQFQLAGGSAACMTSQIHCI
jgi:N-dimethylarginine dimethylaminohydrolase